MDSMSHFLVRLIAQRWLWWLSVAVWGVVLFTLSSQSTLPPGPEIPFQDKIIHFLYFSGGGFCFVLAYLHGRGAPLKLGLWALAGAVFGGCIGALDEFHQTFTPGRSGNDVGDWLADFTGAATGALVACWFVRWTLRQLAK